MERDIDRTAKGIAELMASEGADSDRVHRLVKYALESAMDSAQTQAEISGLGGTASFKRWWIQCDQVIRREVGGEPKQDDYPDHHDTGVMAREPVNTGPGRRTPIRVGGCTLIPFTRCYLCYEIDIDP